MEDPQLERPLEEGSRRDGSGEEPSSTSNGLFGGIVQRLGRVFLRDRDTDADADASSSSFFGRLSYTSLPSSGDDDIEAGRAGGPATSRAAAIAAGKLSKTDSLGRLSSLDNPSNPVCLICLDQLTPDDFRSGEAIQLECACRGDLAMRHRTCAAKWAGVKGDNVCDICRSPITNLPPPIMPERGPDSEAADFQQEDGELNPDMLPFGVHSFEAPSSVDLVFDCIRVMWVAMIVCILFFEMDLSSALWTGVVVGLGYTLVMRFMYRSHLAFAHTYQQQASAVAAAGVLHEPPAAPAAVAAAAPVPAQQAQQQQQPPAAAEVAADRPPLGPQAV